MARIWKRAQSKQRRHALLTLATSSALSIANPDDSDDEDEYMTNLAVAHLALSCIRKERSMPSGKFGPRGPYD
jgi:hypothetical protein